MMKQWKKKSIGIRCTKLRYRCVELKVLNLLSAHIVDRQNIYS